MQVKNINRIQGFKYPSGNHKPPPPKMIFFPLSWYAKPYSSRTLFDSIFTFFEFKISFYTSIFPFILWLFPFSFPFSPFSLTLFIFFPQMSSVDLQYTILMEYYCIYWPLFCTKCVFSLLLLILIGRDDRCVWKML
jgi:hypothetical protein